MQRWLARLSGLTVMALMTVSAGCAAQVPRQAPAPAVVRPGIDVLLADSAHLLSGRNVGLVTNHTGIGADGTSDVEKLLAAGVALPVVCHRVALEVLALPLPVDARRELAAGAERHHEARVALGQERFHGIRRGAERKAECRGLFRGCSENAGARHDTGQNDADARRPRLRICRHL